MNYKRQRIYTVGLIVYGILNFHWTIILFSLKSENSYIWMTGYACFLYCDSTGVKIIYTHASYQAFLRSTSLMSMKTNRIAENLISVKNRVSASISKDSRVKTFFITTDFWCELKLPSLYSWVLTFFITTGLYHQLGGWFCMLRGSQTSSQWSDVVHWYFGYYHEYQRIWRSITQSETSGHQLCESLTII